MIFHQEIYAIDGICVEHTDLVDHDKGYVDEGLDFTFFEFIFSIFFVDEIGLDLFGKDVFYPQGKKGMHSLSADIER
jgi:hypothetical protein